VRRLLITADVVPSSPILATLMMQALISSETAVLTRAIWRNIPEDAILQGNYSTIFYIASFVMDCSHNVRFLGIYERHFLATVYKQLL
jgi:hypothetical protein